MKIKYRDVLTAIRTSNWKVVTLSEYITASPQARIVAIYHDVDEDINKARQMALLEHEMEIYSTYFLLNTQEYFQHGVRHANYMYQLGHEVGLHIDVLSTAIYSDLTVHGVLMQNIMSLAQHGMSVNGVSSHNTETSRNLKFNGCEYFYELTKEERLIELKRPLQESRYLLVGVHPLKEYGLRYEASTIPRENFIHNFENKLRINRDFKESPNNDEDILTFFDEGYGKTILGLNHVHWDLT